MLNIFVNSPDGLIHNMQISEYITIAQLKQQLCEKLKKMLLNHKKIYLLELLDFYTTKGNYVMILVYQNTKSRILTLST